MCDKQTAYEAQRNARREQLPLLEYAEPAGTKIEILPVREESAEIKLKAVETSRAVTSEQLRQANANRDEFMDKLYRAAAGLLIDCDKCGQRYGISIEDDVKMGGMKCGCAA